MAEANKNTSGALKFGQFVQRPPKLTPETLLKLWAAWAEETQQES